MGENGTPAALLAVFRAWMDAPSAAQYACQALDSLLSKHEGNQLWFGEHGLGEGLVRCMALHQNASPPVVLEYALWALYNLCVECPSNQVSLQHDPFGLRGQSAVLFTRSRLPYIYLSLLIGDSPNINPNSIYSN